MKTILTGWEVFFIPLYVVSWEHSIFSFDNVSFDITVLFSFLMCHLMARSCVAPFKGAKLGHAPMLGLIV